ncbi:MAG TPA: ATP synthase F1 subunit delta [Sphingomonadales bacterium]|nr:ATP synthase F1 subunit delta [Sphingomonadales bacterium]
MTASGLEGRYALALFALAEEEGALEAVEKDCQGLAVLAAENRDFAAFIKNPLLNAAAKGEAAAVLAADLKLHALTGKFLGVLAENRRLAALPKILAAFAALLAAERGETTAFVTSAEALTGAQEKEIAAHLEKALGKKPAIETRIDADLLGGLKVQVGSKVIDGSLKAGLAALTLQMKGA